MAKFYQIHKRAIDRAFPFARPVVDYFRVSVQEPFVLDPRFDDSYKCARVGIITFVLQDSRGVYAPAAKCDYETIEDWNKRHKETPDWRFGLPRIGIQK